MPRLSAVHYATLDGTRMAVIFVITTSSTPFTLRFCRRTLHQIYLRVWDLLWFSTWLSGHLEVSIISLIIGICIKYVKIISFLSIILKIPFYTENFVCQICSRKYNHFLPCGNTNIPWTIKWHFKYLCYSVNILANPPPLVPP